MTDSKSTSHSGDAPPRHHVWHRLPVHDMTARTLSIVLSLFMAALLFVLLALGRRWHVEESPALFWITLAFTMLAYVVVQQWTLANQTAREDEIAAAADKFIALFPFIVCLFMEVYWLGRQLPLTPYLHLTVVIWSVISLLDFFVTDITNQRLRLRQFQLGATGS
jgi:hypothetical protein